MPRKNDFVFCPFHKNALTCFSLFSLSILSYYVSPNLQLCLFSLPIRNFWLIVFPHSLQRKLMSKQLFFMSNSILLSHQPLGNLDSFPALLYTTLWPWVNNLISLQPSFTLHVKRARKFFSLPQILQFWAFWAKNWHLLQSCAMPTIQYPCNTFREIQTQS